MGENVCFVSKLFHIFVGTLKGSSQSDCSPKLHSGLDCCARLQRHKKSQVLPSLTPTGESDRSQVWLSIGVTMLYATQAKLAPMFDLLMYTRNSANVIRINFFFDR